MRFVAVRKRKAWCHVHVVVTPRSRYPCRKVLEPPRITKKASQRSFRHLDVHDAPGAAASGSGGGYGAAAAGQPRTPDWQCPTCTMANPGSANACGACASARPPRSAPAPSWNCAACTFLNDARAVVCATCSTPRGEGVAHAAPAASAPPAVAPAAAVPAHQSEESKREAARLAHELESMRDEVTCAVCLERRKNVVFQCGHQVRCGCRAAMGLTLVPHACLCLQVCDVCSPTLQVCPMCRAAVTTRIKMF